MAAKKEYIVKRAPALPPTHPGAVLRDTVLPALGLSVKDAAKQLRVSRQALHRILSEQGGVSPEMAVRLGRFCGNGPDLWLRLQIAYDLHHAEARLAAEVRKIPTHKAA